MTHAWRISVSIHASLVLVFALVVWLFGQQRTISRTVKVTIQEVPTITSKPPSEPPVVQVTQSPPPPTATKPKPVFGLSKNAQTSEAGTVEVKRGNTIAKEIDQEKADSDDALPVPAAEFLVTQMPRLKSEIRIPYPKEARAKNIEGAVIMDILVDETGKVRQAVLVEGPGFGLNEAAMEAIYRFEFEPAKIEQKTVAVKIRYAYRFVLN